MYGYVDEEATNRVHLERMSQEDLVNVNLKLQRQINVAHEKIRENNRNNLHYNGRLEREKQEAKEFSNKVKNDVEELCNEMDIHAFTHNERCNILRNALNALNASNISFKQQFSELCDDMKIHTNNNQVTRYNDLRRFMKEIFISYNNSDYSNNSDGSTSASNSNKRHSDTLYNRPRKISKSYDSQIQMLDAVISNLHDRHTDALARLNYVEHHNGLLLDRNKVLEDNNILSVELHDRICDLTSQSNSWKDRSKLFEAQFKKCMHLKVGEDVLSEKNRIEAMVNLSRFNDEKIRNKELDRKIVGYAAKIQILRCEISNLVGAGATLRGIPHESDSASSSIWSSPAPATTRRRPKKSSSSDSNILTSNFNANQSRTNTVLYEMFFLQKQTIDKISFTPIEQDPDGNCLFHSLCASPYISINDHSNLRKVICEFANARTVPELAAVLVYERAAAAEKQCTNVST